MAWLDSLRRLIIRSQRFSEFRNDRPLAWIGTVRHAFPACGRREVLNGRLEEHSKGRVVRTEVLGFGSAEVREALEAAAGARKEAGEATASPRRTFSKRPPPAPLA